MKNKKNVPELKDILFQKNVILWLTTAGVCGIITNVAGNETPARHMEYAAVAHLVERHLAKVEVASSSLVGRSICGSLAQLGEHLPYKQRVSGSSPLTSTIVAR